MSRNPAGNRAPSLRIAVAVAALFLGACSADPLSAPSPLLSTDEPTVTPYDVDYTCEEFRELIDNDFAIQTCWSSGDARVVITPESLAADGACVCNGDGGWVRF
jgi:hypothetical protein